MAGEAGCVGGGRGLRRGDALLQAGRHLRDGVTSDARVPGRGRVAVRLHHGGQHGNVVALGAYHWVLGHRGAA